ncbi:ATP-dependent Clp protease ATP-binding subunit [Candidatus Roizmanbacteria bacterium]|nr:ATP-dependent Clp protease ATP-binding subunit [Candidatus Roizmanbacteria bacterium]
MRKNFWQYYLTSLHNFGEAIINIFIFLPYFFSVSTLLKTLFQPWRNLIVKKTIVGFSLADWANRLAFNFISRAIGAIMRLLIIIFYFIFQTLFMVFLPFIALLFFLLSPIFYLLSLMKKSPDEQKKLLKEKFVSTHLLNKENFPIVENWFEKYYRKHLEKVSWWKLTNLFSYPPLARDWAVGYTPVLDQYATDLATSTYLHHIKNIVDREKEIKEIEQILTKSIENNVIIVGEEGVGKHTIIDALAKKIYLGKTNIHLMYRRILKLNMERVLREKIFEDLLEEAQQAKNIILFIDNLDKYINLTISLEKYSKSNLIQIIGITTPFAYQSFIFPNEKIKRIFNKVDVYEVTDQEAENILLESVFAFEDHYKVFISYEAVKEVIEKSEFYLTYIPFPEKAVDLLDMACVYTKQNRGTDRSRPVPTITPEIINAVLTAKTHIPTTLTKQMKEKLLNLETLLFSRIIQQDEAIKKLSSALRRSFLLIGKRKKPLATFLFLGPTGVGKTETAKAITEVFFSNSPNLPNSPNPPKSLIRFDMSEFQSKYDIPKLIGDSNSPGLLTQTIREQSYGVLLLDEIEKADKDLINIFLTIVDEGYFIDGQGKRVDCKNLVIIATSNAKNENIFSPEFLNRFDGVIAFQPLSKESIDILAKKIINRISIDIFKLYKVKINVSEKTLTEVSQKGYDPRFGARNLERTIRDEIEDKVAKLIFEDKVKPGETIDL